MTRERTLRVGMYARVSSDRQAKDNTVASQIDALHQRIEQDGMGCPESMRFIDDGYSGGTLLRPALERLRDCTDAHGLDRLYVHSPDRLARDLNDQILLLAELKDRHVDVVFLNHPIGTTPEENLLLQMQGMFAEYERAKIRERTRRGRLHAARHGAVSVLSAAPYGYRYISKDAGGGRAEYQVVLEEARVVQRMYEWVGVDRFSIGEVCRRLKNQGIRSPLGKSLWERSTVHGILKNPAYKGSAAFGRTRKSERRPRLRPTRNGAAYPRQARASYDVPADEWIAIPVPSIVTTELFAAVADQLADNRARQRENARGATHLLQGLLVCGLCRYAYYGKRAKGCRQPEHRRAYYRCSGADAHRFGGQRLCTNKPVRTDMLDEAVWSDVRALLNEPERIEQEYERRLHDPAETDGSPTAAGLATAIRQVERAIDRLVDAYQDGLLSREDFEPRIRQARQKLDRLKAEAETEAAQAVDRRELRLVIGRIEEFARRVHDGLGRADGALRREIVRALVNRVEVGETGVRIVYRVSPTPTLPTAEPTPAPVWQHCTRRRHEGTEGKRHEGTEAEARHGGTRARKHEGGREGRSDEGSAARGH